MNNQFIPIEWLDSPFEPFQTSNSLVKRDDNQLFILLLLLALFAVCFIWYKWATKDDYSDKLLPRRINKTQYEQA